jgi:hypothetical protein
MAGESMARTFADGSHVARNSRPATLAINTAMCRKALLLEDCAVSISASCQCWIFPISQPIEAAKISAQGHYQARDWLEQELSSSSISLFVNNSLILREMSLFQYGKSSTPAHRNGIMVLGKRS